MHNVQRDNDFLVETLSKTQRTFHFLPMLKGMLKTTSKTIEDSVKGGHTQGGQKI